jgi:hypothetical protein
MKSCLKSSGSYFIFYITKVDAEPVEFERSGSNLSKIPAPAPTFPPHVFEKNNAFFIVSENFHGFEILYIVSIPYRNIIGG